MSKHGRWVAGLGPHEHDAPGVQAQGLALEAVEARGTPQGEILNILELLRADGTESTSATEGLGALDAEPEISRHGHSV